MSRAIVCSLFALVLCTVTLSAKEYKEVPVTNIDLDKKIVIVKIDDKEVTFVIADDTTFANAKGKAIDKEKLADNVKKRLADGNVKATLVTAEKDEKEVLKDGKAVLAKVTFAKKQ
jgi:hypothetical protein